MAIHRNEYMDGKVSHDEYYGQYLTPEIINLVRNYVTATRIERSADQHFNDIPLRKWDSLEPSLRKLVSGLKENGEAWSLSTSVCIAKAAARAIKASL